MQKVEFMTKNNELSIINMLISLLGYIYCVCIGKKKWEKGGVSQKPQKNQNPLKKGKRLESGKSVKSVTQKTWN